MGAGPGGSSALVRRDAVRPSNSSDAQRAVEDRLNVALAVLRVVVTLNMWGMTIWRWDNFVHPAAGGAVVVALTVWTALVLWLYRRPSGRRPLVFGLDLAFAVAAMASTPWLKGEAFNATVPGFWVMGPLLVWAVHWHWRGGLAAGVVLTAVDLTIRQSITQTNYGNVFLIMVGGTVLGYMCGSLVRMAEERAEAERLVAVEQERTRLARAVHDGVLQVLALVQRRGTELGGDFSELGRLAGEQEGVLRSLIHAQDTVQQPSSFWGLSVRAPRWVPSTMRDLAGELELLSSSRVTVVTPGGPVLLDGVVVEEVLAAVRACLDNVRMHVGLDAPAWVLLEAWDDRAVLTVRDEGTGIVAGRLDAAVEEGRIGVRSSIRGRIAEVGGTAEVISGAWGTEWEFVVPR